MEITRATPPTEIEQMMRATYMLASHTDNDEAWADLGRLAADFLDAMDSHEYVLYQP